MARVKKAMNARKKHKKVLKLAKGFIGARSKLYRPANQFVMKALKHAYVGRKLKKRDFRKLWIQRINAAARANGMSYSRLMNGLKLAGVEVNRKMLAEMAIHDEQGFAKLVEV
ncbi:MAG: 50S ribosomal protein L20, partial [Paraclostridium sp.]